MPVRDILPEKYKNLLGEIALTSAQLEYSIGDHISMLLNLSPAAAGCIIAPMNLFTRLDVLGRRLGSERIRSKKKLKEFDSLIQRLKKCSQDRNTAIHGRWWPEKEQMTLDEIFQMMEGTLQVSGYRAKNKKQILRATQLAKLAKDLDEGGTAIWAMAKSTWFRGRIDAVRRREVLKYGRSKGR
jgi:hypothetical protein